MDIKRSVISLRFLLITILYAFVLIAGTWDEMQYYVRWKNTLGGKGLIDILSGMLFIDKVKVILVLLSGGLYTDSFCRDEKHHYLRAILTRTDLFRYTVSRVFSNILTVLAGSFAGFFLYGFIAWVMGIEICSMGTVSTYYTMADRLPVLYIAMIALQFGMISAACCSIGLLFSAYQPDTFVSIGLCGMVFFIATSFLPPGTPFDVYRMIAMMPVFPGENAPEWANWLWGMLFPAAVIMLCSCMFYRRMKWRRANGYL